MNSLCTEAEMLFIDHGTISLVVPAKSNRRTQICPSSRGSPTRRLEGRWGIAGGASFLAAIDPHDRACKAFRGFLIPFKTKTAPRFPFVGVHAYHPPPRRPHRTLPAF